jgi:hypothetical protein
MKWGVSVESVALDAVEQRVNVMLTLSYDGAVFVDV